MKLGKLNKELKNMLGLTEDPVLVEAGNVLSSVSSRLFQWAKQCGNATMYGLDKIFEQMTVIITSVIEDILMNASNSEMYRKIRHIREELLQIFGHFMLREANISSFEIAVIGWEEGKERNC